VNCLPASVCLSVWLAPFVYICLSVYLFHHHFLQSAILQPFFCPFIHPFLYSTFVAQSLTLCQRPGFCLLLHIALCACVCVCVRVRLYMRMFVCVHVCVCVCVYREREKTAPKIRNKSVQCTCMGQISQYCNTKYW
jgi:hypothetical protein